MGGGGAGRQGGRAKITLHGFVGYSNRMLFMCHFYL